MTEENNQQPIETTPASAEKAPTEIPNAAQPVDSTQTAPDGTVVEMAVTETHTRLHNLLHIGLSSLGKLEHFTYEEIKELADYIESEL